MKPQINSPAPDFTALNQKGETVSLTDFKGKKVILYFYPKDNTSTCTTQACNIRDNYNQFINNGYVVLGVSIDDAKSHNKFINKYELPFDLLVDTDHQLVEKYGVWIEKSMYGKKYMGTERVTFIINENGVIENIIDKVISADHTNQIFK
jgi:peroxiredoxin Q/BCP